jgi:hypothetical protein
MGLLLAPALGIVKRFGAVVVARLGEPDCVRTGDAAAVHRYWRATEQKVALRRKSHL